MGIKVTLSGWPARYPSKAPEGLLRSFAILRGSGFNRVSRPYSSFSDIRTEIEGSGKTIFVKREHLPADFMAVLLAAPGKENVGLVIFCGQLSELRDGYSPPQSITSQRMGFSYSSCAGVPLRKPVPDFEVEIEKAFSFGESELRSFLGVEHFASAGKAVLLPLAPAEQGMRFYEKVLPSLLAYLK